MSSISRLSSTTPHPVLERRGPVERFTHFMFRIFNKFRSANNTASHPAPSQIKPNQRESAFFRIYMRKLIEVQDFIPQFKGIKKTEEFRPLLKQCIKNIESQPDQSSKSEYIQRLIHAGSKLKKDSRWRKEFFRELHKGLRQPEVNKKMVDGVVKNYASRMKKVAERPFLRIEAEAAQWQKDVASS